MNLHLWNVGDQGVKTLKICVWPLLNSLGKKLFYLNSVTKGLSNRRKKPGKIL